MNKKQVDMEFGEENEIYIKDIICHYFQLDTLKKLGIFHQMDFVSNDNYFEVKSRRNNYDKFTDTMVGYNKIKWIKDNNIKDAYFVFVFNDGNYYYKYNPNDNFITGMGGRMDRGKSELKKYYYIPIDKLKKII